MHRKRVRWLTAGHNGHSGASDAQASSTHGAKQHAACTSVIQHKTQAEEGEQQQHAPASKTKAAIKRPAQEMGAMSTTGVLLQEKDLEKQNSLTEEENHAVNHALSNCLNQLRQRDLMVREWLVWVTNMETEDGSREAQMKEIYKQDLEKQKSQLATLTETD